MFIGTVADLLSQLGTMRRGNATMSAASQIQQLQQVLGVVNGAGRVTQPRRTILASMDPALAAAVTGASQGTVSNFVLCFCVS